VVVVTPFDVLVVVAGQLKVPLSLVPQAFVFV
jgi:hypothetical protein